MRQSFPSAGRAWIAGGALFAALSMGVPGQASAALMEFRWTDDQARSQGFGRSEHLSDRADASTSGPPSFLSGVLLRGRRPAAAGALPPSPPTLACPLHQSTPVLENSRPCNRHQRSASWPVHPRASSQRSRRSIIEAAPDGRSSFAFARH